jgi:hypothetical protein
MNLLLDTHTWAGKVLNAFSTFLFYIDIIGEKIWIQEDKLEASLFRLTPCLYCNKKLY